MQKNTASKWVVFAFNRTDNVPLAGDAANITANVRIDGGAANPVDDTNPTELEDGYYIFDITAAECNGDYILIAPSSVTANIQVVGVPGAVWTDQTIAKLPTNYIMGSSVQTAKDDEIDKIANLVLVEATITFVSTQTYFVVIGSAQNDHAYKNQTVVIYDVSQSNNPSVRKCTEYIVLAGDGYITIDSACDFTMVAGDIIKIFTDTNISALALASVCTETRLAELDAANLITDVANVKADTAAILLDTAEIGAAGAGLTAIGDTRIANLDTTVSSRLAPAGTLATVTNLTNAPTAGDFTSTMKTSLNAATPASVQNIAANGSGFTALGDTRIANLDATVSSRLAPAGTLANVTLVATCTTNSDMRGTDNAALASVLGAAVGASISADIAAVKAETVNILVDTTAIKAKTDNLPSGIAKNVALSNFQIFMVLLSDHVTPATGKTVVGTISKDGGAFAAVTNAITEIGNGLYKLNLTQTEMNADVITLKFTETNCDQRTITVYTT